MNLINYISSAAMPMIILLIIVYGIIEKNKVFDSFLEGAQDGIKITLKIFPTLVGLFVSIGALRGSGFLDMLTNFISPLIKLIKIPSEIMPLAILRPISGSSSIAIATDIMKNFGVDSKTGLIASTIMGSTETTLYTIAIYTEAVGIKKIRFVLLAAICADIIGIIVSVLIWNFLVD